jgi:Zn-dependent M28 family amino/carboxypeptidase
MRNRTFFLLLILLTATPLFCQIRYLPPDPAKIDARLHKAEVKNPERQAALETLFKEAGCSEALTEQQVKGAKTPNIICTLAGESEEEIIVGAHYDKVPDGRGVIDNWSGASLLPTLLESLKGEKRHHTLVFIGFTNEEEGEIGSHFYVKQLAPEQIKKISAMVNMDTLALGPTEVWASHADPGLVNKAFGVAQAMKIPISVMNVEQVGTTDSEQFREKKVPAITFHSLTSKTFPILHSKKDDFDPVQMQDYCQSANLIAAYVAYLDATLPMTPKDGEVKQVPGK